MQIPLSDVAQKSTFPGDIAQPNDDTLGGSTQGSLLQLPGALDSRSSASIGDLRSASSSSICEKVTAAKGLKRLKAALLLTTDSNSGKGTVAADVTWNNLFGLCIWCEDTDSKLFSQFCMHGKTRTLLVKHSHIQRKVFFLFTNQ